MKAFRFEPIVQAATRSQPVAAGARLALLLVLAAGVGAAASAGEAKPAAAPAADSASRVLRVGPKEKLRVPSAAAKIARDGDTIEIAAGEYKGDAAVWTATRLKIVGVGGRAHLKAEGKAVEGKGIWVARGDDIEIENIEFSGAKVPNQNGAGIRAEGRKLTVRNSYFHDNENGILGANKPENEVVIEHCEFSHNGFGDGQSHNLYIGTIAKLTVTDSYLHHAVVGHNLKSRAAVTIVTGSRLADEAEGRGSYEANFPNGGQVLMTSNVLMKGPGSKNPSLVSFGEEGLSAGPHEFVAKDNTFVNMRTSGSIYFIVLAPGISAEKITDNVFVGSAGLPPGVRARNTVRWSLPDNLDWKPVGFPMKADSLP